MFTKVLVPVPVPVIFVLLTLLAAASSGVAAASEHKQSRCLSWRVAVEANNARAWSSVPPTCVRYVQDYMLQGQYQRDLDAVTYQIFAYLNNTINVAADGMDAWVLDIDDTILSNLLYYEGKHYGGDPYDPLGFRSWAQRGICAAIPKMLRVYKRLIEKGFKVFLITGRDAEMFNSSTSRNLDAQGFKGHERLIMRGADYRGVGASVFKPTMRKQLMDEGYIIRGNVGDQWSDLLGECNGDRIFKVPNPMYFVP